jgi:microcystin-dependent protein
MILSYPPQLDQMRSQLVATGGDTSMLDSIISLYVMIGTGQLGSDNLSPDSSYNNAAGTITMFGGATAPAGWLICDGSAIGRQTYSNLFNIIGVAYGAGDSSTTFNIPDMRGRVAVGKSSDAAFDNLGEKGGHADLASHSHSGTTGNPSANHTHGISGSGNHTHQTRANFLVDAHDGGTSTYVTDYDGGARGNSTSSNGDHNHGGATGTVSEWHTHGFSTSTAGSGNAGNLQPYQVINYIIKT